MSSTETSGAPAEATATNPAPDAAFPTFGTTRGSGLSRGKGKRPSSGPAATAAAPSDYKPTAIEVVQAPREYTNPFAPATPAPAAPAPAPVAEAPASIPSTPAPVAAAPAPAPVVESAPAAAEAPAELNILPPAEQKTAPAQTWESEGFRPGRAERAERSERPERTERPRREERAEAPADEPVDIASIPEKFLYVRPGVTFVPTPRNWGGAPRERRSGDEGSAPRSAESPRATESAPAAAPEKSGGFLGWLKGLFGSAPAASESAASAPAPSGEQRREGGERRSRGGRSRGGPGGERRSRGGRGRSGGGYRAGGSSQGGI